jgi:hypothetical protein
LKKHSEEHPEIGDLDDTGSSATDGLSTADVSGTGTPAAAGQPKLKLTFHRDSASASAANGEALSDEE